MCIYVRIHMYIRVYMYVRLISKSICSCLFFLIFSVFLPERSKLVCSNALVRILKKKHLY